MHKYKCTLSAGEVEKLDQDLGREALEYLSPSSPESAIYIGKLFEYLGEREDWRTFGNGIYMSLQTPIRAKPDWLAAVNETFES